MLDHGSIARESEDRTGRFARRSEISDVPIGRLTEDKLEGGDFGCSHCNNLEKEIEKEDEGREQVAQRKVAKDRLDSWKYLTKQSQRI
jgi:hypothetical protein